MIPAARVRATRRRNSAPEVVGGNAGVYASNPFSHPIPAEAAPGDMLVLFVFKSGTTTAVGTPTGWNDAGRNVVYGGSRVATFTRIMQSGDTAATIAGSSVNHFCQMLAVRNGATVDAISGGSSTPDGSICATPSVTTIAANSLVLRWALWSGSTATTITWAASPVVFAWRQGSVNTSFGAALKETPGASGIENATNPNAGPRQWQTMAIAPA